MWQSISSTTQLICIEARTKEATKKICGILWSLVVTCRHDTAREERSWLNPAGPGVGNPHAPDAGAEGLKCWGWWDWEDLKSFFTKKQAAFCKTSFFSQQSNFIKSSRKPSGMSDPVALSHVAMCSLKEQILVKHSFLFLWSQFYAGVAHRRHFHLSFLASL